MKLLLDSSEPLQINLWRANLTDHPPRMVVAVSDEPLWDAEQAAKYLNYSVGTLAVWRCNKRYDLKPMKIGRRIRYQPSIIRAFAAEHFLNPN